MAGEHTEYDRALGAARRFIRAAGRHVGEADPAQLPDLVKLHDEVERALAHAVESHRAHGALDREIGEVLGITRQAVQKRWPRSERVVGAGARYRAR